MRKVCVVVTARPSYARIWTALDALNKRADVDLQLVVTGSALLYRYGNAIEQIRREFKVAAEVWCAVDGSVLQSMPATAGLAILQLSQVLQGLKPDVVVTIADRYETLATAVAASYLNIPLAHVQGGEITGSIDEKVRHAVTRLADLHFVASAPAKDRLIRHGEPMSRVWNTGCPSVDLADRVRQEPDRPFDPQFQYGGIGDWVDVTKPYVVVLQHPVTTHAEDAYKEMQATLQAVEANSLQAFIFWPNIDAGGELMAKAIREHKDRLAEDHESPLGWRFYRHLEALDFLRLVRHAQCLVGNSSVGIRECSYMGVPVVNIGDRQAGRDRGPNVVDVESDARAIVGAIDYLRSAEPPDRSTLYGTGIAGETIAALLASAPLRTEKRLP